MPDNRAYTLANRHADKVEPRVARAIVRAGIRLRPRIPVNALTEALEAGDFPAAQRLLDGVDVADAYQPAAAIVAETVVKGAKLAVPELNAALED